MLSMLCVTIVFQNEKRAKHDTLYILLHFLFQVSLSNDFFELFFDIKRPLSNLIRNDRDRILYLSKNISVSGTFKRFLETRLDIAPFSDHVTNVRILTHVALLPTRSKKRSSRSHARAIITAIDDYIAWRNNGESFIIVANRRIFRMNNRRSIVRGNDTIRTMRRS